MVIIVVENLGQKNAMEVKKICKMSNSTEQWYIIKLSSGHCQILPASAPEISSQSAKLWGPFNSKEQAIASRIGLIRAGKCQPI